MALSQADRDLIKAIIMGVPTMDKTETYQQVWNFLESDAPPDEKVAEVAKALGRPLTVDEQAALKAGLLMTPQARTQEASLIIGQLVAENSGTLAGFVDQVVKAAVFILTPWKWF